MTSFDFGLKDPDATLDYIFDWAEEWLDAGASEAITSHTIIVSTGLTLDSDSEAAGIVTAWISGGTAGKIETITCRITTDAGRTDDRTATLQIKER